MKCSSCGGAIVLISGKGGGYYGCYNAKRRTCTNNLLVPRKRIERAIIAELKERINHRLEKLRETLSRNTVSSALALKEVLGTIRLEPVSEEKEDFYGIMNNGTEIALVVSDDLAMT